MDATRLIDQQEGPPRALIERWAVDHETQDVIAEFWRLARRAREIAKELGRCNLPWCCPLEWWEK